MTNVLFSDLGLSDKLAEAVAAMGFDTATPVQAQAIPLIRTGVDVIARSQTGTGKTAAFAIPALERIDTKEDKPTVQALILCPTRELAQQAGEEVRKLARFMPGIRPVEIYGGADMERQFIRLRRANVVIGTPGRVMDHMRRKTLKLGELKMIVLDEADEMLKMGFKEDIETILVETPAERQTVLFSATMPPAIQTLAKQFLREPQMVEIDKDRVTILSIDQSFVDVPMSRKADALMLMLRYYDPQRALVFCNTKRMVDELVGLLEEKGFAAQSIHGDLSQAQRTNVMNGFKRGKVSILIATDVAARGIDVSDLDYVFNYDIPMKTEHYVHRIGRTGRAGKSGCAVTICCGKRQMHAMAGIAREVKSEIRQADLPTPDQLQGREAERNLAAVETLLAGEADPCYTEMVSTLVGRGHEIERVAATLMGMHFPKRVVAEAPIPTTRKTVHKIDDRTPAPRGKRSVEPVKAFADILLDVGSSNRVAANHLVGAITELSGLSGKQIGKIHIYPEQSVVGIPADRMDEVLESLRGCKICGKPTHATPLAEIPEGHKIRAHKTETKGAPQRPAAYGAKRKSSDPVRRKTKEN